MKSNILKNRRDVDDNNDFGNPSHQTKTSNAKHTNQTTASKHQNRKTSTDDIKNTTSNPSSHFAKNSGMSPGGC